jgi:hypothetical protein
MLLGRSSFWSIRGHVAHTGALEISEANPSVAVIAGVAITLSNSKGHSSAEDALVNGCGVFTPLPETYGYPFVLDSHVIATSEMELRGGVLKQEESWL